MILPFYTSIVKNDAVDVAPAQAVAKTTEPEKQVVAQTEIKPRLLKPVQ
jgi:hypothetical protein